MAYIDVHSHLDICKNPDEIIKNARKNGVKIILTCGIDRNTNRKTLELSEKYYEVKACLGIYPIDALKLSEEELDNEVLFIRQSKNKIVGIGEVGLDLKESNILTLKKQKDNLQKFINLSKEINKPIIIHSRQAESEAIELLEKSNCKKVLMHCFSGNFNLVKKIINNKWYLSIPANVKNSEHFQNVIKITPLSQLLCETDSPFLHPDKLPNNESSNVIESYKKIAQIKDIPLKEVEKAIEGNYNRLFG